VDEDGLPLATEGTVEQPKRRVAGFGNELKKRAAGWMWNNEVRGVVWLGGKANVLSSCWLFLRAGVCMWPRALRRSS
jgi:hypothetical protein